ncbi:hypothetical protein Lal_00012190, partial [Lupinus albus]
MQCCRSIVGNLWMSYTKSAKVGSPCSKSNMLEHQKFNDLVFVRYNLRLHQRSNLRHQNYDPINLEIYEDHSHFILEESPPFLTVEEIEALRNDLANIFIQLLLDDND